MTEHSTLVGGSTAGRVMACPGSVKLSQKIPKGKSSKFADRGTLLHMAMEKLLKDPDALLESVIGMTFEGITLDQKLHESKIEPAIFWYENTLDPDEAYIEVKLPFDDAGEGFGTGDVIYKKGQVGGVADWKFGDGVIVPAENNAQGLFYLYCARKAGMFKGCKKYRFDVFQPSERVDPDRYHSCADYIDGDLDEFGEALHAALELAKKKDAPFATGDHCGWCPVNLAQKCPMIIDVIGSATDGGLRQSASPAEVARLLDIVALAEPWCKSVQAFAQAQGEQGTPALGWKMVRSLANRAIVDEELARGQFVRAGMTVDEIYAKNMKTPAQLEKAIKAGGHQVTKNWTKNVDRAEKGRILVRDSDKREAVGAAASMKLIADHLKIRNLAR